MIDPATLPSRISDLVRIQAARSPQAPALAEGGQRWTYAELECETDRYAGLLRALGARRQQILALFLAEAGLLAAAGGVSGLALGIGLAQLLHALFPALPVSTPWSYALLAEGIAVAIGVAAGVVPALRAARLDPVEALRAE